MKHDWKYKKLGDVCESDLGKTLNQSKDTGDLRPYLCAINVQWDSIDLSTIKQARFEDDEVERYSVKMGDLLVCEGGDTGRAAIWSGAPMLYQNALHRVRFNSNVAPRFALLYLRHLKKIGKIDSKYSKGVTIKHLVKSSLMSIPIPVPPLPTQRAIVAELDTLNEILDKKRQQLKELDTLAQSIFYDMFGDPVENEKGWEVKKLGEVAPLSEFKGEHPNRNGKYWLLNLDKVESQTGQIIDVDYYKLEEIGTSVISFDESNVLYSKLRPYLNKVVIPEQIGYATSELVPLKPQRDILNRYYLAYMLRSKAFVSFINIKVAGAKMPRVSMGAFRSFPVPLPPLSLQQTFAEKIEAIEKQKELIKASIAEVETLLAERMEYWFGE